MNGNNVKELILYREDYSKSGWTEICETLRISAEAKEVTIECKVSKIER